jgi:hypothetical protein
MNFYLFLPLALAIPFRTCVWQSDGYLQTY